MTLAELRDLAMYQYNQEAEDAALHAPALDEYINSGYSRVYCAWHSTPDGLEKLRADGDVPNVPERYHGIICDFATYLLYRNGNGAKQSRGYAYLNRFNEEIRAIYSQGGAQGEAARAQGNPESGIYRQFYNIPE